MKLSELMTGKTVNPDYEGWSTNDDNVLAINIGGSAVTDEDDYEVLQMGLVGVDSSMNAQTQDKTYIRAGQSTTKTGNQRTFAVTMDRYLGDAAQEYCLSHGIKYGTGNGVVVDYVYFNILTGKGEKGKCAIIVDSDGSGNAGESSAVSINMNKSGAAPTEYTYTTI